MKEGDDHCIDQPPDMNIGNSLKTFAPTGKSIGATEGWPTSWECQLTAMKWSGVLTQLLKSTPVIILILMILNIWADWKFDISSISGVWVSGALSANPLVRWLTAVESFSTGRVHFAQVWIQDHSRSGIPSTFFASSHVHLFFVPRGLFLYVETEALLDTNSFSSTVKRNSDILTFVKVPRQPFYLKN